MVKEFFMIHWNLLETYLSIVYSVDQENVRLPNEKIMPCKKEFFEINKVYTCHFRLMSKLEIELKIIGPPVA